MSIYASQYVVVACLSVFAGEPETYKTAQGKPSASIQIIARIGPPRPEGNKQFGGAFRSVALRWPWLYAMDRQGNLYVYSLDTLNVAAKAKENQPADGPNEVDEEDFGFEKKPDVPAKFYPGAGDGQSIALLGDVLLLTKRSQLEVFSIKDGATLEHSGPFGPAEKRKGYSLHLLIDNATAYLISKHAVSAFDISKPQNPQFKWNADFPDQSISSACTLQHRLFASTSQEDAARGETIGFCELTPTGQRQNERRFDINGYAYHLLPVSDRGFVAFVDNGVLSHSECWIGGVEQSGQLNNSAHYLQLQGDKLTLVETRPCAGARSATVCSVGKWKVAICNGSAFLLDSKSFANTIRFPRPSTHDGFPYQGASERNHFALAGGDEIVVGKIRIDE